MTNIEFAPATMDQTYLRMLLTGATGTGKTLTALKLAKVLSESKVAVIDTEHNSARLFVNNPDVPKPYYVFNLTKYAPANYVKLLSVAYEQGFDLCIIDSLTPSWSKRGGILDIADGDVRGWKTATPIYNDLVDAIISYSDKMHIIATARSKMEVGLEPDPLKEGKIKVVKRGMLPILRDQMPYEFDIVGDLDADHIISFNGVGKARCEALDGRSFEKPGLELGLLIKRWLTGESEGHDD